MNFILSPSSFLFSFVILVFAKPLPCHQLSCTYKFNDTLNKASETIQVLVFLCFIESATPVRENAFSGKYFITELVLNRIKFCQIDSWIGQQNLELTWQTLRVPQFIIAKDVSISKQRYLQQTNRWKRQLKLLINVTIRKSSVNNVFFY